MPDRVRPDPARGVFETLLILDGAPVELDAHLERLDASVRALFGVEPPGTIGEVIDAHAASMSLGRLRLTVAPTDDGVLDADVRTSAVDPDEVFPPWERASALRPRVIAGGLGAHKWADRSGPPWEASHAAGDRPTLVLDADGDVLEADRANVFAVERGALLTPVADGRILAGVTRARTIELARALGLEVREQRFSIERLLAAGEAFLTGSVRGVEPVRAVGDVELAPPSEAAIAVADGLRRSQIGAGVARPTPVH